MLYALKYSHWSGAAADLAARMARLQWPSDVLYERSLIVPVPLAKDRLRERGFNQSALLARHLATHWQIPILHALTRSRPTQTQTRLTPADRQRNVAGAFVASVPKQK